MGKALRVFALILLLAGPARAGFLPNGSPEPPEPQGLLAEVTAEAFLSALTSVLALV